MPSGAAGSGWSKPEEPKPAEQPQPEVRQSALTAGSNWASQNRQDGSGGWVPPARDGPFSAPAVRGSFPVERHLNPEEYPSLAAVAKEKPPSKRQHFEHQAAAQQHQHHQVCAAVASRQALDGRLLSSSCVHKIHHRAVQHRPVAAAKWHACVGCQMCSCCAILGKGAVSAVQEGSHACHSL